YAVSRDEVRLLDDGGHAVRPADVLRVRADREVLRVALADQLPQRGVAATRDVDVERRRGAGGGEEAGVGDVGDVRALPGRERARRACRRNHESDEHEVEQVALHPSSLVEGDRTAPGSALSAVA